MRLHLSLKVTVKNPPKTWYLVNLDLLPEGWQLGYVHFQDLVLHTHNIPHLHQHRQSHDPILLHSLSHFTVLAPKLHHGLSCANHLLRNATGRL
jgi:hypothetical protein